MVHKPHRVNSQGEFGQFLVTAWVKPVIEKIDVSKPNLSDSINSKVTKSDRISSSNQRLLPSYHLFVICK
jgi:hypothetical protein